MSFFKKPNRKFRQRTRADDDDEEDKDGTKHQEDELASIVDNKVVDSAPTNVRGNSEGKEDEESSVGTVRIDSKQLASETSKKLSFHEVEEGEDGDVFKVKKSSHSRRILRQLEKERKKQDKEKIKKEKTISQQSKLSTDDPDQTSLSVRKRMEKEKAKTSKSDDLKVIWVKSESVKTSVEPTPIEIPAEDPFSDDSGDDNSGSGSHAYNKAFQKGAIPDARTIYEVRKQRQMAREAEGFIAVTSSTVDNSGNVTSSGHEPSRLSNDDDDDDDEDDERISFTVDKQKAATEQEMYREAIFQSQVEDFDVNEDSDSGDELQRWEREQIRKGIGAQTQNLTRAQGTFVNDILSGNSKENQKKSTEIPKQITQPRAKVGIDQMLSKLRANLSDRKESLESYERQLVQIGIESMQSEEAVSELKAEVKHIGKEFEFYQIMSNYISSKLPS